MKNRISEQPSHSFNFFAWQRKSSGYVIKEFIHTDLHNSGRIFGDFPPNAQDKYIVPKLLKSDTTPIFDFDAITSYSKTVSKTLLFGRFASLSSEQDILAFANDWGFLTLEETALQPDSLPCGESLSFWQENIRLMKYAQKLLFLYNNQDDPSCLPKNNDVIIVRDFDRPPGKNTIRAANGFPEPPGIWIRFEGNNYLVAGACYRWEAFNRLKNSFKNKDIITTALQYVVNDNMEKFPSVARMLYNPDKCLLEQYIVPKDLIGFMWLQIYAGATRGRTIKLCIDCQKWFDLTDNKGASRWKRCKWCSGKARIRDFRS